MNEVVKFSLPTQAHTQKILWAPLIATLLTAATLIFAHNVTANTDVTTETAAPILPTENHTPVIFTANYKANIKGFAVKASRELKILDSGEFALSFNATSWAAKVEESSIFNWKEGKVHPISYRYFQTAFGKEREQSLAFNSTDNTINSDNNGEKRVITQITHTLDKLNYQLQLQQDLLANHSGFEYTVVNKGNLKNYRFETLGEETIDTNSGSLNTIKIKVIRENQEKTTYIWFAKDWNNLLAKLEQYNGDKQTLAINLDTASVNNIPVKGN
jgi:hypothetical protein